MEKMEEKSPQSRNRPCELLQMLLRAQKHFSKISAGAFLRTAAMQEGVSFFRPPPLMFNGDAKNRGQSIVDHHQSETI